MPEMTVVVVAGGTVVDVVTVAVVGGAVVDAAGATQEAATKARANRKVRRFMESRFNSIPETNAHPTVGPRRKFGNKKNVAILVPPSTGSI